MKKGIFVFLLISALALSAVSALGNSEATTSNTSNANSSEKTSAFKRGVTYSYDEDDSFGSFLITMYDDGTFFFVNLDDSGESTEGEYYLVGNAIYVDYWFARYYLEYSISDGYCCIGTVDSNEKSITLIYAHRYPLTLNRI